MSESRDVERLNAFTDGVMAIAITLLVLDIRLPRPAGKLGDAELLSDLLRIWPQYLGYVVSFLVIGEFWAAHMRRLRTLESIDAALTSLNILFLLVVGFIPFVTSVLSDNDGSVATILYATTVAVGSLLLTLLWHYAVRRQHVALPQEARRIEIWRSVTVPAVFGLSIVVAWLAPHQARLTWLLLIPLLAIGRLFGRKLT